MAIRKRLVVLKYDPQVPASQTDLVLVGVPIPATGVIKSIKGWAKAVTDTCSFIVNKSGAAGSTGAASTTDVCSDTAVVTDTVATATLSTTLANRRVIAGEVLYLKATSAGGSTIDGLCVTVEIDY